MAKLARDCGINANLVSTWVRKHERKPVALAAPAVVAAEATVATAPAFVSVHIEAPVPQAQAMLQMQARLPNGVVVDLGSCDLPQACELLEVLGRMRCSASTRT